MWDFDGGDGPDFLHLWNYDAYLKEDEDDFNRWKADMELKMDSASFFLFFYSINMCNYVKETSLCYM